MGYYGRYVAKKNANDEWMIIDDECNENIVINSSQNQNQAYIIATQLNNTYQLGIKKGINSIRKKLDDLLFLS